MPSGVKPFAMAADNVADPQKISNDDFPLLTAWGRELDFKAAEGEEPAVLDVRSPPITGGVALGSVC